MDSEIGQKSKILMTSPFPLPTLPRVPPPLEQLISLPNLELKSLIDEYRRQNYTFVIHAGTFYISQSPMMAADELNCVRELIGDAQYAMGSYEDANRSYSKVDTKWGAFKCCLAKVLRHETSTTGGYNVEDLSDAVRSLDSIREEDVGEVHWVTIVGLRRAVLQNFQDKFRVDGEVGFWARECLGSSVGVNDGDWFKRALNVDLNSITVEGMDALAYSKLRRTGAAGKGEEVVRQLHDLAENAMNMTPSSNVPYNCMGIWLRAQLPETQVRERGAKAASESSERAA